MFFDDHKKAITTIISKRHGKGGPKMMGPAIMKPEVSMSEGGELEGRHAAAQDIIGAHQEKSPEKLMHALANFIDLHLHEKEGNVPEPEPHEHREPM
jgi:hypothetical protein